MLTAHPSGPLRGTARAPSDKSISHRALILGALAEGETRVTDLLEADDVLRTAAALRALGAEIEREAGVFRVRGGPWRTPPRTLYLGNAGTGARLLMGAAAGQGVACAFDGDGSLRARPMGRITEPLTAMGAATRTREGRLPVRLSAARLRGLAYRLPKPSAQVKSAVLLAGLGAAGETVIEEPVPVRDHTENMLRAFGAALATEPMGEGLRHRLPGGQGLVATEVRVPSDPSSAAFPLVAALIVPGSEVTLPGVMTNPRRTGLLRVLARMGARIETRAEATIGGEPTATLTARGSGLRGALIPAAEIPDMVDEVPILAVAAAFAEGVTRIEGLEELRVKESDRLDATAALLRANGVTVRTGEDWLEVEGAAAKDTVTNAVRGGGIVEVRHDHRIAMSALVLGLGAEKPVRVDDAAPIETSFPGFRALMEGLGARIA